MTARNRSLCTKFILYAIILYGDQIVRRSFFMSPTMNGLQWMNGFFLSVKANHLPAAAEPGGQEDPAVHEEDPPQVRQADQQRMHTHMLTKFLPTRIR